jgi:hypothetical protein
MSRRTSAVVPGRPRLQWCGSTIEPRIYGTGRVASGRPCQVERKATDGATRPQGTEGDPKHSIKVGQYRPLTLALICRELKPQSGILEGNHLMTAQEESDESKDGQDNCWHVASIVNCIAFAVNLLREDTLMANNNILFFLFLPRFRSGHPKASEDRFQERSGESKCFVGGTRRAPGGRTHANPAGRKPSGGDEMRRSGNNEVSTTGRR